MIRFQVKISFITNQGKHSHMAISEVLTVNNDDDLLEYVNYVGKIITDGGYITVTDVSGKRCILPNDLAKKCKIEIIKVPQND